MCLYASFYILCAEAALKQCRNIARQYSYFSRVFQSNNNAVSAVLKDVFTYERYWQVIKIIGIVE